MSYRLMFIINAIVALAFGLGFLIVPSMALNQFDADEYASTVLATRFFGTAMLAIGLLLWFAKDVSDAGVQRGMGIGLLTGAAAGLIVTVIGTAAGILRANGWLAAVIYALFAVGYAFLIFLKPRMDPMPV